jgi:hypothetical protein
MKAPSFRPERTSSNVVLLHYFSHYHGLAPYALSHVAGTAKLMYGLDIEISHAERRDEGADHDIFRLTLPTEYVAMRHGFFSSAIHPPPLQPRHHPRTRWPNSTQTSSQPSTTNSGLLAPRLASDPPARPAPPSPTPT